MSIVEAAPSLALCFFKANSQNRINKMSSYPFHEILVIRKNELLTHTRHTDETQNQAK